jgi:hypothetical protein
MIRAKRFIDSMIWVVGFFMIMQWVAANPEIMKGIEDAVVSAMGWGSSLSNFVREEGDKPPGNKLPKTPGQ